MTYYDEDKIPPMNVSWALDAMNASYTDRASQPVPEELGSLLRVYPDDTELHCHFERLSRIWWIFLHRKEAHTGDAIFGEACMLSTPRDTGDLVLDMLCAPPCVVTVRYGGDELELRLDEKGPKSLSDVEGLNRLVTKGRTG